MPDLKTTERVKHMTKFMLLAGTALAITVGAFGSASALPTVSKSTGVEQGTTLQPVTFFRWRHWDGGRRWHHRRYYRRNWY